VGDSRAVVINEQGLARPLTVEHKLDLPEEK